MEQIRNTQLVIGTTQTIVSVKVEDKTRKVIVFTNVSTGGQTITLALGQEATAGYGIPLTAYGSTWVESVDSSFKPSPEQWWAISSGAGGLLAIHERLEA